MWESDFDDFDLSVCPILRQLQKLNSLPNSNRALDDLEEDITDFGTFLTTLRQLIQYRKISHAEELARLQREIDSLQLTHESKLDQFVSSQEAESEWLSDRFDAHTQHLLSLQSQLTSTREDWNQTACDIRAFDGDVRAAFDEMKITQATNSIIEDSILELNQRKETYARVKAIQQSYSVRIDRLEKDLIDSSSRERERKRQYDVMLSDCHQAQELMCQLHQTVVQSMETAWSQKEGVFLSRLQELQRELESKEAQYEEDCKFVQASVDDMLAIKNSAIDSFERQVVETQAEIERLGDLFSTATDFERSFRASWRSSMLKTDSLARENQTLSETIKSLQGELDGLRKQSSLGERALKNAQTQQQPPEPASKHVASPFRHSVD
jgi:DNA repair exonuclease SbcCD ATPase subunit